MADYVDDIKSRIDIVDLVSQYVQLKKNGVNYKGLCPFHSEKTPSFIVSPEKQICHCFGCNKGGDIFSFIEQVESVPFAEAMRILADRAGVKIDEKKLNNKQSKTEKDEFFRAHDLACDFFQKQLHETAEGKKVLAYLANRGLNDKTIKEFRIGFAPDKYDALYPYLLKNGISHSVLIKSGLVSAKNISAEEIYDKYRTRLIFPIFDFMGRICGFGGRALKKDQMPKYLNSPENIIYSKGKVLYGLSQAKQAIKEKNQIILVEGYFDVILPHQEGIKNIVATSGTALTTDHVRLIKRLTPNIVSCFDSDEAGFEATKRAYFVLQNVNLNLKTIGGLNEKDPADYVKNGGDFLKLVENATDFVSFFMNKLVVGNRIDQIEGRKVVISSLLPCYKAMSSTERDFYIRELASKMSINERNLYDEIENFKLPADHPAKDDTVAEVRFSSEEIILSIIFEYPGVFSELVGLLENFEFEGYLNDVYKVLTTQYNALREKLTNWDFGDKLLFDFKPKIDVLRLYAEQKYQNFTQQTLVFELEKLVDRVRKDRRIRKLKMVQQKIEEAEKLDQKEKLNDLLLEQQKLLEL